MGWNDIQENNAGSGAKFLKIKGGGTAVVHIIDDEPHSFKSVYFNALRKGAVVDPDNNPMQGVKGFDLKTRHAINVYDYADNTIKVLAGSNEMFNTLKAIHSEWGGFSDIDLKISRSGDGLDTKYTIVPTAKCRWNEAMMDGQVVFDLNEVFAPTPEATIKKYMQGVDPSGEFNAEELEAAALAEAGGVIEDDGAEPVIEDEPIEEEAPAPKPKPAPTKLPPPAKPAALNRNELIMKINHLVKSKLRYKKQGVWLLDVQKIGGKDKKSMSQLGVEDLAKLFKHVQTVK